MRSTILNIIVGSMGLVYVFVGSSHFAQAALGACDLQGAAQKLQNAKMTSDSDSLEAIRAALATRKTILKMLIICGHDDAVLFRDTVKGLSLHDNEMGILRQSLVNNLDDAIASYDLYISQIDGVGIRGSQDIARSLFNWRKNTYIPLEARASHVIIWANNQDIFDKAGRRIVQISQTIRSLALIDNENIKDAFAKAQRSFQDAGRANQDARTLLLRNTPSENELPTIKRSLELLAETYTHLFELSGILGR